jgi:hypothetical protein
MAYKLGLSLHYFTDLSQPMHAVNYVIDGIDIHSRF